MDRLEQIGTEVDRAPTFYAFCEPALAATPASSLSPARELSFASTLFRVRARARDRLGKA